MSMIRFLLGGLCLGLLTAATPALAQAPLFTVPELSSKQLQERAQQLSTDAIRLARVARLEEAEALAALAVQLSNKDYQTYTILGVLSLQNNKPEQALTALRRAAELAPDKASVQFNLALVYQRQKDYPKAANAFERGLKLDPKASDEHFNLGNVYVLLGRRQDAMQSFKQAVALRKNFWEAVNNIGLLNTRRATSNEAKRRWQEAIDISERDERAEKAAEPRLALGVALYAQGQQEAGLALSEEALTIDRRYGELDYLKENLWGERLLADTARVLGTPRIRAALQRIPEPADDGQETSARRAP